MYVAYEICRKAEGISNEKRFQKMMAIVLAVVFIVTALPYQRAYAEIISPQEGVIEYLFYNNSKEAIEKDANAGDIVSRQLIKTEMS